MAAWTWAGPAFAGLAGDPSLQASPAWELRGSTSAELGEPVAIEGSVLYQGKGELALDLEASATDQYAISEASLGKPQDQNGGRRRDFRLQVIPLDVGPLGVSPAWSFAGDPKRIFRSPPFRIQVREPVLAAPQLRDIKGPRAARLALWPWLLALAAALGGWALWRRRRRGQAGTGVRLKDLRPPEEAAHEKLELLESSGLWEAGRFKEFYAALTDILRQYLERRCGIPATRLTSSELQRHMRHAEMDREVTGLVRELTERADLVKFAKVTPEQDWGPGDLEAARRVVRETSPKVLLSVEGGT